MRRDSDRERFATLGGLVLGQLRAAGAQLSSGAFAMEKSILVQTMCHTPEDLETLSTMNGLWDPAKHQRGPSNTETPKALGGHSD